MDDKRYVPFRQQIWHQPVFSPEEPVFANGKGGESVAPTRHQVDCWKAEASNFAATLDEPPYGRRDRYDLIATRAYQAGFAAAQAVLDAFNNAPFDEEHGDPDVIAAILRAVADQVVPDEEHPGYSQFWDNEADQEWQTNQAFRRQLLAIAAELRGTQSLSGESRMSAND